MRRDGQTVHALFEQERPRILPLVEPFDPRKTELSTVRRMAKVRVGGAAYSVPSHWKLLEITAMLGCDEVTLINGDERETYRRGAFGESQTRYRHYLPELSRKPQALRQVVHELLPELDAVYGKLWRLLVVGHGPLSAARLFGGVLEAVVDRGDKEVSAAIAHALKHDRIDLLGLVPQPGPSTIDMGERITGLEARLVEVADSVERCFARQNELADTMSAFLDTVIAEQRGEPVAGLSLL